MGSCGRSGQVQAERNWQHLGHMPLLGVHEECFGVPGLEPEEQSFGKLHRGWGRILPEECTKGRPWEMGKSAHHRRRWGSHAVNLH